MGIFNYFSVTSSDMLTLFKLVKVRSYIAQSLGPLKVLYASPPGRPIHNNAVSSRGNVHLAISTQLLCEDYSFIYPPLSATRYSFTAE